MKYTAKVELWDKNEVRVGVAWFEFDDSDEHRELRMPLLRLWRELWDMVKAVTQ